MIGKLTFVFFVLFTSISFSQTNLNLDELLLKKYSEKEINTLKKSNIEMYNLYNKSFNQGILLIPFDEKQKEKGHTYESLNIVSIEGVSFNYLAFNLDLKNETQYYLINGGQSLLIIKGITVLNQIK